MPEIITRSEAKALGLNHYFTGKPCKHGHISPRFTKGTWCVKCASVYRVQWREENRDYALSKQRERYWKDIKKNREYARNYAVKRRAHLKKTIHITLYEERNLISYESAIESGLSRYFTGLPCRKGHVAEKLVSNRGCIICKKKSGSLRWTGPENPIGEIQWLRKNKAQLRQVKKALRNLGASQSQSEA